MMYGKGLKKKSKGGYCITVMTGKSIKGKKIKDPYAKTQTQEPYKFKFLQSWTK